MDLRVFFMHKNPDMMSYGLWLRHAVILIKKPRKTFNIRKSKKEQEKHKSAFDGVASCPLVLSWVAIYRKPERKINSILLVWLLKIPLGIYARAKSHLDAECWFQYLPSLLETKKQEEIVRLKNYHSCIERIEFALNLFTVQHSYADTSVE